jgi:hypothetical protein
MDEILKQLKNLRPEDINSASEALGELIAKLEQLDQAQTIIDNRRRQQIEDKTALAALEKSEKKRLEDITAAQKELTEAIQEQQKVRGSLSGPKSDKRKQEEQEAIDQAGERLSLLEEEQKKIQTLTDRIAKVDLAETNHNRTKKDARTEIENYKTELEKLNIKVGENVSQLQEMKSALDTGGDSLNTIQQALGKTLGGTQGGFLGQIYRSATSAIDSFSQLSAAAENAGGWGKMLSNSYELASKNLKMIGGPIGLIGGAFIAIMAKMSLEVSNLSRELGAATGLGNQFTGEITRMAQKGNMAGIGFRESADALKLLTTNLSSFNPKAERTNEYVGLTVARLGKLGATSANAVKNVDLLQRAFGMTAEQAADTTAQIVRMGKSIGITSNEMLTNFETMKTRIAAFGNTGMRVFKEMNALVKATGIALADLQSIASGLDTFDAAADSAGKLNAVLGTQLSTLELLEATDSQRIMMIKQQVQTSVGNFENLDKYTKMYVAQAMGLKDVDKAQRLLNMSTAEYNKYTKGQQEQADIQAELAEATAELVPMMTQLKLVGTQVLMVFGPVISFFSGVIGAISEAVGVIGWFVQGLGSIVGITGEGGEIFERIFGAIVVGLIAVKMGVTAMLGPWGLLIAGVTALWAILHKPGSLSMSEGLIDKTIAKSISVLGEDAMRAQKDIAGLSSEMEGIYDATHKGGGAIDMQAMANLDATALVAGLTKIKSAMVELSTLKIDGFLAMTTDGAKSSIVMGSQGVIKSLSEGRLSIDVNMPEISLPPINVVVQVNGQALEGVIDARVEKRAIQ